MVSLVVLTVAGLVAGRLRGAGFDGGRPRLGAGPILLVSAASVALAGLFLEALFRTARLQSLQAYDAWAFWVPKGQAIFFFDGLDAHVFTTAPNATYPPLQPVLDAAAFHAMGGAGRRHAARAVLVPRRRSGRRGRRAPPPARAGVAPLAAARCSSSSSRASASGCSRRRPTSCVDVLFVVGALLLVALWLRDRRRLAPRRRRGAARRGREHEARGHPLRGVGARGRRSSSRAPRCVASARGWRPSSSARAALPVADLVPARHDIGGEAPSIAVRQTVGRPGRARPLVRRPLRLECALVRASPSSPLIALAAALVWGDRRARRVPRGLLGARLLRRRRLGRPYWLPGARRSRADEAREPDRALHGRDRPSRGRRPALAPDVGLAKPREEP